MKPTARFGLSILLVAAIALPAAAAYVYPLSSIDIRNAYFLGTQNDERSADVFLQYVHHLPAPKAGVYISEIGIDTPYTQVAELCAMEPNEHAQEAEQKYLGKPLSFLVHVVVFPGSANGEQLVPSAGQVFPSLPDYWSDMKYRLVQDKEIPSKSMRASTLYSSTDGNSVPVGERVELEFDAEKIKDDTITIEVDTPDGQHVETTFNLAKLKYSGPTQVFSPLRELQIPQRLRTQIAASSSTSSCPLPR